MSVQKNKIKKGLSKSLYIKGLQCHKCLYLNKYHPELKDEITPQLQAIFDSGTKVGILAQQLFPGGIEVPYEGLSYGEQLGKTKYLVKKGTKDIYEATFSHEGIFIKVDILHKGEDGWEIYEVKSSTGVKDVYYDDVALQYYVLKGCGLNISKAFLVHINNEYVRHGDIDVNELFFIEDLTDEVIEKQDFVASEVLKMKEMLGSDEPDIDIGEHCRDPYDCEFIGHCWRHIPENSVFDFRGRGVKKFDCYRQGLVRMEDVPFDLLSPAQLIQLDGYLNKENVFNEEAVREFLDELWYPISFFDFETSYMVPVPMFDGVRPYQQVPFQYSLHVQQKEGAELKHFEYLSQAGEDPRRELIEKLLNDIPENSCVLAYNMSFETGILNELKGWFPEYEIRIDNIIANMRDLMIPFRSKAIYHWQMEGSYSLKKVLPALVPELSYERMDVSDGAMASDAWLKMITMEDVEEIENSRKALLEYCGLDTLAMVKILEKIKKM
jgi:hypothetical protein